MRRNKHLRRHDPRVAKQLVRDPDNSVSQRQRLGKALKETRPAFPRSHAACSGWSTSVRRSKHLRRHAPRVVKQLVRDPDNSVSQRQRLGKALKETRPASPRSHAACSGSRSTSVRRSKHLRRHAPRVVKQLVRDPDNSVSQRQRLGKALKETRSAIPRYKLPTD